MWTNPSENAKAAMVTAVEHGQASSWRHSGFYSKAMIGLLCLAATVTSISCISPKEGASGNVSPVSPAPPRTQRHHFAVDYTDEELRMRTLQTWRDYYSKDLSKYGISREYAESRLREKEVEALGGVFQDSSGMLHVISFEGDVEIEIDYYPNGQIVSYRRSMPGGYESYEASSATGRWNSYRVVKHTINGETEVFYADSNNDGVFEHQEMIEKDDHSRTTRTEVTRFSREPSGDWTRHTTTKVEDFPPVLQEDASGEVCPGTRMEADAWIEKRTLSPPTPVAGCQDKFAIWKLVDDYKTGHGPKIELDAVSGAYVVSEGALVQIEPSVYIVAESETEGFACGIEEQERITMEFEMMRTAMDSTLQHFNLNRYREVLRSFRKSKHPIYISCHARTPGEPTATWLEGEYGPEGTACYLGATLNSVEFTRRGRETGLTAILMDLNMLRLPDQAEPGEYRLRMTLSHEFMHVIGLPRHSAHVDLLDDVYSCERAIFCTGYGEFSGEGSRDNKHRWITRDAAACSSLMFEQRILTNFEVRTRSGSGICRDGTCSDDACAELEYTYCDQPIYAGFSAFNYQRVSPPKRGTRIRPREHIALQCGYCDGFGGFGWEKPGVPGPIVFRQFRGVQTDLGPPFTLNRCERLPEYCWSPIMSRAPWVPGWESLGRGKG